MIHPARLQALAKNSKPSSRRSRLVSRSSEPFAVSQKSHILTCAASLNSPHRGPPKSFQRLPAEYSLFGVSDSPIKTHSSDTKQRFSSIHFYLTGTAPITFRPRLHLLSPRRQAKNALQNLLQ